jgi:hypothetical protein
MIARRHPIRTRVIARAVFAGSGEDFAAYLARVLKAYERTEDPMLCRTLISFQRAF